MSFAQHDIDASVAQIIPAQDAPKTQVLVVSTTPAIGKAMAAEMSQDPSVEGHLAQGTLSEVSENGDQDWSRIQFVAFQISTDRTSDLRAVSRLTAMTDSAVQFVAMTDVELTEGMTQTYKAAGVQEILFVGSKPVAQKAAEVAEAAPVAAPLPPTPAALMPTPVIAEAPAAAPVPPIAMQEPAAPTPPPAEVAPVVTSPAPQPAQPAETHVEQPTEPLNIQNGKITVILRARGGAGASTLAVNLAVTAAKKKDAGKTALVDLDIQNGTVGLMLDLGDSAHATKLVTGAARVDSAFLDAALVSHESGVDVLTAPDVFAPLTALKPELLASLLDALQGRYDNIILDMPQGVVDWIEPVLAHAARVLVVTDTSLPSVKRTRRLIDLIKEDHITLPVDVVINQQKRPRFMTATHKEIELLIDRPLEHWIPMDAKAARRATDMGQPLQSHAKRSAASRAIGALGETLFNTKSKG